MCMRHLLEGKDDAMLAQPRISAVSPTIRTDRPAGMRRRFAAVALLLVPYLIAVVLGAVSLLSHVPPLGDARASRGVLIRSSRNFCGANVSTIPRSGFKAIGIASIGRCSAAADCGVPPSL